jgi:hypothetical protein
MNENALWPADPTAQPVLNSREKVCNTRATGRDPGVPGALHQGILSLLCDDPWLAFDRHGREHPVDGTPIDRRADFDHETDDPEKTKMRYADGVLVVRDPHVPSRGVVLDIEVQRKRSKGSAGG